MNTVLFQVIIMLIGILAGEVHCAHLSRLGQHRLYVESDDKVCRWS